MLVTVSSNIPANALFQAGGSLGCQAPTSDPSRTRHPYLSHSCQGARRWFPATQQLDRALEEHQDPGKNIRDELSSTDPASPASALARDNRVGLAGQFPPQNAGSPTPRHRQRGAPGPPPPRFGGPARTPAPSSASPRGPWTNTWTPKNSGTRLRFAPGAGRQAQPLSTI